MLQPKSAAAWPLKQVIRQRLMSATEEIAKLSKLVFDADVGSKIDVVIDKLDAIAADLEEK